MGSAISSLILCFALAVFGPWWMLLAARRRSERQIPSPPGPKGLPVLGNLLDIPADRYWLKIDEWVCQHGPVISLNLLGKNVVVLGSAKVAADLLERRSAIYSDRPRWVVSSEILARGMHVGVMPVGDIHRRFRKAIHAGLNPKALSSYHAVEEHEAKVFVKDVLEHPEAFRDCIKRFSAAVLLHTTYGHATNTLASDPFAARVYQSATTFASSLAPGKFLVDILPWLRYVPNWFPGAGWKRKAAEWQASDQKLYMELLEDARANARRRPSFISEGLLENGSGYGVTEEELAYIGGTISQTPDTTMSVLTTLFLALTAHPTVLVRAQAEIDHVIGRARWPTFADRENLPYVGALIREVCRWRPVAPLGVPHASSQDDVYEGYLIPKGTMVISAIWSIHHNPDTYHQPETFNPERFLTRDADKVQLIGTEESRERGHHMYGFGRRMCPGATMADHAVFALTACVLWALDIRPPLKNGVEVLPAVDPTRFSSGGEASHPLPFACRISLRPGVQDFLEDVPLPAEAMTETSS